jgi:hypothetical protein
VQKQNPKGQPQDSHRVRNTIGPGEKPCGSSRAAGTSTAGSVKANAGKINTGNRRNTRVTARAG